MTKTIFPGRLEGSIRTNASKSHGQRALACAALAKNPVKIYNLGNDNDTTAAIGLAQSLGAEVLKNADYITVFPKRNKLNQHFFCGESGLSTRMFAPIAALFQTEIQFSGEGSVINRPMTAVVDAIQALGADVDSNNGYLPFKVKGPIKSNAIEIDGSGSSQILTGILIALSANGKQAKVVVNNLKSKPYVDLTIQILKEFGIAITNQNYECFEIPSNEGLHASEIHVESDWSGASNFAVAGAIAGHVELIGLNMQSTQADMAILQALKNAGANMQIKEDNLIVSKTALKAFEIDATEHPDLFPPLVSLAACCEGTSKIKGVHRLKHKESNRAEVLIHQFKKLGVNISLEGDQLIVSKSIIHGGEISSHNDHRIAMAASILALVSKNEIIIDNFECVNKSYPEFYAHFIKLGGKTT